MPEKTSASPTDDQFDIDIYHDLYHRSRMSVLAYFFLFWALVFLTPFFKEQRGVALSLGLPVTVVVIFRFLLAIKFSKEKFVKNPVFWKRSFAILVILSALLWGLLNVLASSIFGVLSPAGFYCLIMTCGILAGGTTSLAPSRKIMTGFLVLMLLPYMVWAFFTGDIVLGIFMTLFMALFTSVTKESNKFYMSNLTNTQRMTIQSEQMADTVNAINADSEKLRSASQTLTDISRALTGSSGDMSNRIGDIERLSLTMKESAEAVSMASSKTSGNVESVSGAIRNISTSIDQASQSTDKVMHVTSEAVDQALVASEKIDVLKQAAQEIGKITEIISDISDQTNLLALNATIEAARAGEAGKGFAVVATEIKELARQTASATAKIKSEVEGIQSSTESSASEVKDISQVISSVKDQVALLAEAVTDQGMMSGEIVREIEQMTENMSEISRQVESNESLVQDMQTIITEARAITDQVLDLGTQSSENASGLLDMARNLNQLSDVASKES